MLWLRNLNNAPAGEYYYHQAGKTFGPSPLIRQVAGQVADFRKGNDLPRSHSSETLEDIIIFTAQRLGFSEWTYDTDQPAAALMPPASGGGCSGCGVKL